MKLITALLGSILISSSLSPATAGSKSSRSKPRVDINSLTNTQIMDALFARGLMDENGHFFTRQELADQQKVLTTQQIAQLVLPSVVRLTVVDTQGNAVVQGSGFVVGKNMIATNVHVILGAHAVTANFQNGRSEAVKGLVNADVSRDIALVYADTTGVRPLLLAAAPAQVGDPVVAAGSPKGLGGSISTGIISGLREYKGSKVIQTTAPISPGSSGGALLNAHGQVLGITSFYYVGGQNLNFAYASEYLRQIRPYRAAHVLTWNQIEEGNKPAVVATPIPNNTNPVPANASSEGVYTDKSLTGLKGVWVCVEDIDSDAKKDGLDADQTKVEVELRLRQAGITVFDKINSDGNNSMAYLYVNINAVKNGNGMYGYGLSLSVKEVVNLLRSTPCRTFARTWTTSCAGTVGSNDMATTLRQYVDDEVDRFANDYLAQNPK